jgi:hypothetical protein
LAGGTVSRHPVDLVGVIVFGYHLVDIVCKLCCNHIIEVDLENFYYISKHKVLGIFL